MQVTGTNRRSSVASATRSYAHFGLSACLCLMPERAISAATIYVHTNLQDGLGADSPDLLSTANAELFVQSILGSSAKV